MIACISVTQNWIADICRSAAQAKVKAIKLTFGPTKKNQAASAYYSKTIKNILSPTTTSTGTAMARAQQAVNLLTLMLI